MTRKKQIRAAYEKARQRVGVRQSLRLAAAECDVTTTEARHALGFIAPGETEMTADAVLLRLAKSMED